MSSVTTSPECLPKVLRASALLLAFIGTLVPQAAHCDSKMSEASGSPSQNAKTAATEVATLRENGGVDVMGLDFSADGKFLASNSSWVMSGHAKGLDIHIWDWRGGQITRSLEKEGRSEHFIKEPLRYSPDGHLLATCQQQMSAKRNYVRIWNTNTWEAVQDITDPSGGGCEAIGFTPDGKFLARTTSQFLQAPDDLIFYSTASWEPVWRLRTGISAEALAISPDGTRIALGGYVGDIQTWGDGKPMPTFGNPPLPKTNQVAIVDIGQHKVMRFVQTPNGGRLAWSPDSTRVAVAGSHSVTIFDAKSGNVVASENLDSGSMYIRYTSDGKYILESDTRGRQTGLGIRIWDGQHRNLLQEIPGANVTSLAVSRDGRFFAAGFREKIVVWQLNAEPSQIRPVSQTAATPREQTLAPPGTSAAGPGKPHQIIDELQNQMYSIGQSGGKLTEFRDAEANAAVEMRKYIASGDPAALLEKDTTGRTPLMSAAFSGYPNVVGELLKSDNVKSTIDDSDPRGMSAWSFANFSYMQSMWICNPPPREALILLISFAAIQPYYAQGVNNPYRKARKLLETAGAKPDFERAKQVWRDTCLTQNASTRSKVAVSKDLLETIQLEGAEALAAALRQK